MAENFTVIIPLRAGSKGMPNKNITELDGKPLYMHAVDLANKSGALRIIITTDIDEVFHKEFSSHIEVIARPENLCNDSATMSPVLVHAIEKAKVTGVVVLLQPTSPLRSLEDLMNCLDLFERNGSDVVLTLALSDSSVLKWGQLTDDGLFHPFGGGNYLFNNRQSLPSVYKPNGAIYVFSAEWLIFHKNLSSAKTISGVLMPSSRSHDIDTLDDFTLCQELLMNLKDKK